MASSALKAHLHTSRKIVNDSHTFLPWDFPDLCCDCCFQFTNCLRIVLVHIILEISPQIKIWGVQVWWMRYVAVLMTFWASLGRRRGIDRDEQWFRQDRGHPHTNDSLAWLRERFKDRLIIRKCEIEWAAHSPDLNPPYFYLWGYLKDNVYENNPQTIGELKAAITAKIREIP